MLQHFGYLMQRATLLEKTLMLETLGAAERVPEDEMVGWHHGLNAQEFKQTLGDCRGQGSLVCCSPWGCKESDMI